MRIAHLCHFLTESLPLKIDCLPTSFPRVVGLDIETQWAVDGEPNPYRDTIRTVQVDVPNDETYILTKDFVQIVPLLANDNIVKIVHNVAFDSKFLLHNLGTRTVNVFDTMLVERILTAGKQVSTSLEAVAARRLGITLRKEIRSKFRKSQLTQDMLNYAAQDAAVLYPIYQQQLQELKNEKLVKVAELENNLAPVVGRIELAGIGFDQSQWKQILEEEKKERDRAYKRVIGEFDISFYQSDLFGDPTCEINLNSRDCILGLLKEQGVDLPDYQAKTLELYLRSHPQQDVIRYLLEYKEHEKRLSWDYPKYINPVTGRIHPSISQIGARTGRFAFSNPNLQQVPKLDSFRKMFIAEDGNLLITLDYSQIELRALAEIANDKNMIKAFKGGKDFHQVTAELIAESLGTEPDRALGKGCNFAVVYGSSIKSRAIDTGMPISAWRSIYGAFFSAYSALEPWYKEAFNSLIKEGYTKTISGRKRWFPELNSTNSHKYRNISRNTPIQGSALDIVKLALVYVDKALVGYDAKIVHTIHDEIIIEAAKNQVEEVSQIASKEMIQAGEYFLKSVPIEINTSIGKYWSK